MTQLETVQFRVFRKDLLDVKNSCNVLDTKSAIKVLFYEQYPNKEIMFEHGFSADPDSVNEDAVIVTMKVRLK